jgi:hypothetical protein
VIKLSEALKSNTSLTALDLYSKACCFISFSRNTDNNVGSEGVTKLSEVLKSNTSLTKLNLGGNRLTTSFHSNSVHSTTGNFIDTGVIALSEALKSNSTLTYLDLTSNELVLWFILTLYR